LSGVGRPRAGDVGFERPAEACAGIASDVVGAAYVFFVAAAIVSVVGYRRTSPTPELGSEITVAAVAVGRPSTELGPVGRNGGGLDGAGQSTLPLVRRAPRDRGRLIDQIHATRSLADVCWPGEGPDTLVRQNQHSCPGRDGATIPPASLKLPLTLTGRASC
jgi:hypothetical protein